MWIRRTQDLYKFSLEELLKYHNTYRIDNPRESFRDEEEALNLCLEIRKEHMAVRQSIVDNDPEISSYNLDAKLFEAINGVVKNQSGYLRTASGEKLHQFRTRKSKAVEQEEDDGRSDDEITEQEALEEIRKAASERKNSSEPKKDPLNVRESWKNPDVAKARSTRHNCLVTVNGVTKNYRSVQAAFKGLGLPEDKGPHFRARIKKLIRLSLNVGGTVYHFELVEADSRTKKQPWTQDNGGPERDSLSYEVDRKDVRTLTEPEFVPPKPKPPKAPKQPTANDIAKAQLAAMKEEELSEVEKDPLFTTAEQLKQMSPEEQLALYRQQQRIKRERLAQKG